MEVGSIGSSQKVKKLNKIILKKKKDNRRRRKTKKVKEVDAE